MRDSFVRTFCIRLGDAGDLSSGHLIIVRRCPASFLLEEL
jgi:hypothetical protein